MAQLGSNSVIDTRLFDLSILQNYPFARYAVDSPSAFDPNDFPGMTLGWSVGGGAAFWSGSANVNRATSVFVVGGDNLTLDADNTATGGTLTGFLSVDNKATGEEYFFLVNTAVAAVDFAAAANTVSTADDLALLRAMLAGDDSFAGSADNDYIQAARGNDTAFGGAGNDTIYGDAGADSLLGETGNDSLVGGTGADVLLGGLGNDTLVGGFGADQFTGGAGTDVMVAGVDITRDVFIFTALTDSAVGGARDVIVNFTSGTDDIDLRSLDARQGTSANEAFLFSGTTAQAFSVWTVVTGAHLLVRADVSGDLVADFEIRLNDVTAIQAGDILL